MYLQDAFDGGFAEVSIFKTIDGVRRKARIDYLKTVGVVDLKTYSNSYGARADTAMHVACAKGRHDVQAAWYLDLVEHAKKLPFFNFNADAEWEERFRKSKQHPYYIVYQESGLVPIARGKHMSRKLNTFKVAQTQCETAVQTYRDCLERFGDDPWIVPEPITNFEDEAFPCLLYTSPSPRD